MREKKFTYGVTFFVTPEMYQSVKKDTEQLRITVSDLMRRLIEDYLHGSHSYSRSGFEEGEIKGVSREETESNEQQGGQAC